jgi:hypothetical protein
MTSCQRDPSHLNLLLFPPSSDTRRGLCRVVTVWHLERRRRRDGFVLYFAKASVRHASAPMSSVLAASAPTPWSSRMTPMNVGLIRTFAVRR